MTQATLDVIRQKVRNVAAVTSSNELTNEEIDFYINTYFIYDFPEHLRLKTLNTNFSFFTEPNIDTYEFPVDQFISIQKPIYINGYPMEYLQSQDIFYKKWPKRNFRQRVGTGDGANPSPPLFTLTNLPVLRNTATLSAIIGGNTVSFLDNGEGRFVSEPFSITNITQAANAVISLNTTNHPFQVGSQVFIDNVFGMRSINGGPFTVSAVSGSEITLSVNSTSFSDYQQGGQMTLLQGSLDYITGAISMDWGTPPDSGSEIYSFYYPYVASKPISVLFFENQFILRPIPDRAYRIETEVFKVPTALLANDQSPEIKQWWQLIALGAALKIFEDTQNMEEYNNVYPLYKQQEILANRRTIKQQTSQRVVTPYTDMGYGYSSWFPDTYGGL